MKIKGSGSYTDAAGRNHGIFGVGKLSDDEKFRELKVLGNISFDKISCDEVNISGKCDGGSIDAQDLKISGKVLFDKIFCAEANVSGKCEGKSVSTKNFSASGKMEIDSIKVEQTFELKGKPELGSVEADKVIVESRSGSVDEIKCRKLKIFNHANETDSAFVIKILGEEISAFDNFSRVRIKNIDAEKVEIENCEVDVIRCQDAFIGTNCSIEKLFVAGEYEVAADSTVGETIRI